jgi:DNA-binding PadR family transcriptional regulator
MDKIPSLSTVEAEILNLLITRGEMYGLEMLAASKDLKKGSIYVTLGRMADKGFVESRTEKIEHEGGLPRRMFRATGLGQRVYHAREMMGALLQGGLA